MGLFDNLVNVALSAVGGETQKQGQLVQLLAQLAEQNGGFAGLLQKLQQGDLASIVQSWIGQGANQAVSAALLQSVLGGGLQTAAQKVGLDNQQASSLLAEYLPQIVNAATPNGSAADADGFGLDDVARIAMQILK